MGSESPPKASRPSLESQVPSDQSENPPDIHGIDLTPLTQCAHWHSPLDIIAIKHACCKKFYACISCHNTLETNHEPEVWNMEESSEKAVFCGSCKRIWSIEGYMAGIESRCRGCGARWNPGCKNHWNLYFNLAEREKVGM